MSAADVTRLTQTERYDIAGEACRALSQQDPTLESEPGLMARHIVQSTGIDFTTATIVALSAARPTK